MKYSCICSLLLRKLVLMLLAALFLGSLTRAQSGDFQIMVNGPWSYVLDPNLGYDQYSQTPNEHRVVLVAPSAWHSAYVSPGPNATGMKYPVSDSGIYYLDFEDKIQNHQYGEPHEEMAQLYKTPQPVPLAVITTILNTPGSPRYAISLPMPDYITTYTGKYGSGFAESKIKIGPINYKTPPHWYTIWMVFHYSVKTIPAEMKASSIGKPGTALPNIPVAMDDGRSGVSIALMPTAKGDRTCDSLSAYSFAATVQMWGLQEHARFPQQKDDMGTQDPGNYNYNCPEAWQSDVDVLRGNVQQIQKKTAETLDLIAKFKAELMQAAESKEREKKPKETASKGALQTDLDKLKSDLEYFLHPLPDSLRDAFACTQHFVDGSTPTKNCPTREQLPEVFFGKDGTVTTSVGSSDCHHGQISINNAFGDISQ